MFQTWQKPSSRCWHASKPQYSKVPMSLLGGTCWHPRAPIFQKWLKRRKMCFKLGRNLLVGVGMHLNLNIPRYPWACSVAHDGTLGLQFFKSDQIKLNCGLKLATHGFLGTGNSNPRFLASCGYYRLRYGFRVCTNYNYAYQQFYWFSLVQYSGR